MKQLLIVLGMLIVLSFVLIQMQQKVTAVTVGLEPPKEFMNALKTCTKGTFTNKQQAMVTKYIIKGLLPNGRCEFSRIQSYDFSDPKDYETAKRIFEGFGEMAISMAKQNNQKVPDNFPSADSLINQATKEQNEMICKLSKKEREDLYNAWSLHDDKNPPPKYDKNGYSFSWSSSNMGSYDRLMMVYAQGPCEDKNGGWQIEGTKSRKKYACEYADTTCYITIYETNLGEVSSLSCSGDEKHDTFGLADKVKKHAKDGMCSVI